MEEWVSFNAALRNLDLGLVPAELVVDSGGLVALLTRCMAREKPIQLLA